jgi:hypothetical protein
MKVQFLWRISEAWDDNFFIPTYKFINDDFLSTFHDNESNIVMSYLTDDSGLSNSTRIEILEHFLGILENKEIKEADISGEHYMASIQNQQVELEFVYDENQTAITSRIRLSRAIKAWMGFIKKEPVKGYTEIIEI